MLVAATQVTVNGDPVIAWLTGVVAVATVFMAAATLALALQTRRSVEEAAKVAGAAKEEADATLALVNEARRDRDLAVQPVLVLISEEADSTPSFAIRVRNIGRGPAIRTRVFKWANGAVWWNSGPGFPLASGDFHPPPPPIVALPPHLSLDEQRGAASVIDIPGSAHKEDNEDLFAYCLDQLGNALEFNLRTGDPPQVSRPSDPQRPAWATAAFDIYSAIQPPVDPTPQIF